MKVLLVNPPDEYTIVGNNPELIDEERGFNPPLGLLFLASSLQEHNRHPVEVLDCQVQGVGHDRLAAEIAKRTPDVVGIHAMTLTLVDVVRTAEAVRAAARSTGRQMIVVVGGPHTAVYPSETARLDAVDYVVEGEAERSFPALVDRLEAGDAPDGVPGVFYGSNGRIRRGPPPSAIEDLDALPFPARVLTPYEKYTSLLATRNPVTTMFTSRGCPFRCTFCHRPAMGKRFRAVSAGRVVDEMQRCLELGIREIFIYDDTFTVDKKRVRTICHEILRRRLDVVWDVRAHVNTVDPDLLDLMRRAGCARIHYGIEAGTARVLKVLRKGITLDRAVNVLRQTRAAGISTLAYFMIGNPTETRQEAEQTIRVARSVEADYVHVTILTPFPGTPLYEHGLKSGFFTRDHWKDFAENPVPGFVPPFWEEHMTTAELQGLIKQAYRSFYLRPGYALRRLAEVRSAGELWRKAKAAFKVFRM